MTGPGDATPPSRGESPAHHPEQAAEGPSADPGPAPEPWLGSVNGPGTGPQGFNPASGTAELTRLASRQFVVPLTALAVAVVSIIASFAMSGGGALVNRASDEEVCSAYRAAERSWDSYDTDADMVMKLSDVASRHPDDAISLTGERLDNLPSVFTYSQYSSIVQPIAQLC